MAGVVQAPQKLLAVRLELTNGGGAANYDYTTTRRIEVLQVVGHKTQAAGLAGDTVTIRNAGNAITDAILVDNTVPDQTVIMNTTLNIANATIASGGTLRAAVAGGGQEGCMLAIKVVPA
jgi:hypothetical protein